MLPVPVIALLGATAVGGSVAYKRSKAKHKITDERKRVFERALEKLEDPKKLRALADTFQSEGLKHEAVELRKRANVLDAPAKVKAEREAVFKKALASKDPVKVKKVANAFHGMGYYSAAKQLRAYAAGLAERMKNSRIAGEPEFEQGGEEFATQEEFATDASEFAHSDSEFSPEGSVEGVDAVTPDDEVNADTIDVPPDTDAVVSTELTSVDDTMVDEPEDRPHET